MSDTIVETDLPARRGRGERPPQEREESPAVTIDQSAGPTPAEALAESQRLLQDRDRQLQAERAARAEAERRRQEAEASATAASRARSDDRMVSVNAALEAAKAEQIAARAAMKAAREAGDFDAEADAQEALGGATFRLASATAELEHLKRTQPQGGGEPARQPQTQPVPSQRAQEWIAAHPRFTAGMQPSASADDRAYYADAIDAHNAALRMGYPAGSDAYIQEIDRRMDRLYPDETAARPHQEQRDMDTAPPSRGGGARSGWKSVQVNLGESGRLATVEYREEGGTRRIRFANKADRENFEEGAKVCDPRAFEKDPGRTLGWYVNDQIDHVLEGSPDLKVGDGRIYGRDE